MLDDILNEFAVVAEPGNVIEDFKNRYGALVDRTTVTVPAESEDHQKEILAQLRA